MIALLLALGCSSKPSDPSVILVVWDTVGAEHVGLYGGGAPTPNLAALARRGTRYEQAITHRPQTMVSHWTMFTGAEPALHGWVTANRNSTWDGTTVAEEFAARGYATGAFIGGAVLKAGNIGIERGFHHYDDDVALDFDAVRPAPKVTRRALDWMHAQDGPYFAFVHYFDAHYPYTLPPRLQAEADPGYTGSIDGDVRDLARYQGFSPPAPRLPERDLRHVVALHEAKIQLLDRELGVLLGGLPADTRIVVTSDHGESFSNGYYFNHRDVLTDEVLRVPLVVAPTSPAVVDGQVALTDVFALLLGRTVSTREEVVSQVDPYELSGDLSIRRGQEKVVYRDGGVKGYHGEVGTEVPDWAPEARTRYEERIESLRPQTSERTPGSGPAPVPVELLEALGYAVPAKPPAETDDAPTVNPL